MSDTTAETETTEIEAPEADVEELLDLERAKAKIAKANSEAKGLRATRDQQAAELAELRKFRAEIEDAQKTQEQRLAEQTEALRKERDQVSNELLIERIARRHNLADEDLDLLGSGSEEQIEARALRIAAMRTPAVVPDLIAPPTDRPVEKLRPGVTPSATPLGEADSYPPHWASPARS